MVDFGQCGDDGYCLLAANEDAAYFCLGCGRDKVLKGFANDLDGAVEKSASGGGVAEVEDCGDATACLGEDYRRAS